MEKGKWNIKLQRFGRKSWGFFKENYHFFGAPFCVLALFFITLAIYNVYPFGDRTVASYDLSAQICPFIEHLFNVLNGKSSLSYSYAIAGGADVVGTFLYFFISPFSFLFLICGEGRVLQAASFVIPVKVATIAFVGTWFACRVFQNIPKFICMAVGIVYAYCGYTFVANTYINWLDFLIYLPLCVQAFVHFKRTGKFIAFSLLIAACVYTCFSIACFSMFTVFPILIFYGVSCVEKGERKHFLSRLCLAFAVAILCALPILLPALKAYLQSGRGGGLFDNFWFGFNEWESKGFAEFNGKYFLKCWGESLFRKWTYILSDSVFFVLTIVWFVQTKLKTPFSKFMLVAGILTLLPTLVDESMLLLNMGSYMSYALRFGFLNATYFLGGACLALDVFFKQKTQNEGGRVALNEETVEIVATEIGQVETVEMQENPAKQQEKKKRVCTIIYLSIACVAFAFLIWFAWDNHYKTMWESLVQDSSLKDSLKSFSSRFAHSLGGLEAIAPLFGVVASVVVLGVIFAWKKRTAKEVVALALLYVIGVQVVFYNNQLVVGNLSNVQNIESYKTLSQTLNEREEGYFRVKDYGDDFTANLPFTAESNSFSVFSSVIDKNNFIVRNLFGYMGNGTNSLKSGHGFEPRYYVFADAFMGYKYYFVANADKEELEEDNYARRYLNAYMVGGNGENQEQLCAGEYCVYENTLVFPTAYRVQGGSFRFAVENANDYNLRRINQTALYEYLYGVELGELDFPKYHDITLTETQTLHDMLWDRAADVQVGAGKITASVSNAKAGENLLLNFVASKGYKAFVNGQEVELVENDLQFLCVPLQEGENQVELVYNTPYLKWGGIGAVLGVFGLLTLAFVVKKTKIFEYCEGVIAWAGILLACACVAFFFLFPTCVWGIKLVKLLL